MSYLPNPSDLQYFLEIATRRNISRAAERLGIQQPTLSLALKRLEDGFGVRLMVREKQGVTLTDAGKKLADRARFLLNELSQAESEISKSDEHVAGLLRIGAHASVARYALPGALTKISSEYPELKLSLVHELSRTVQSMLLEKQLDCGLVMNPVLHPDLILVPLVEDEVTIFESRNCKNSDLLILNLELHQMQTLLKKLPVGRYRRIMECTNLEVIARLVHEGTGVGMLPARIAALLFDPPLRRVSGAPVVRDKLYFCYHSSNRMMKSVMVLKDLLKKMI